MELKEFIAETIKQIADGLVEGSNHIKNSYVGSEGVESGYKTIKFDVAITTIEEDKVGAGGKIAIAQVFSIGANGENSSKATNYNRVQFETFIQVKTN